MVQEHGTASTVPGWFPEFAGAVVRQLPRDIGQDIANEWSNNQAALKKVLREVLMPPLLEQLGMITIAPEQEFVARDRFVVNTGLEASVRISFLGSDFVSWFLGQVEAPMTKETTLRYAKLLKPSVDGPILTELGGKAETTLAQIYALMELQKNGEDGALLTNGWANIFYVNGRVVSVYWYGDGWCVGASSVTHPGRWRGGYRVFSRNS